MSSTDPISRRSPVSSPKPLERRQELRPEVQTMFAAVYGTLKETSGSHGQRRQTDEPLHRGRALRSTRFPAVLMTQLAQDAADAAQRSAQAVARAHAQGVTPALVRTARLGALQARRAASLALQGAFRHLAAAERAPMNDALQAAADAARTHAAEAIDSTVAANVSYAQVRVLESGSETAAARAAALRSQSVLNDVMGMAADQLEAEGGHPDHVAALRLLRLEPGQLHELSSLNAARAQLERIATDLAASGKPGLARRVRGLKNVASAAFSVASAHSAAVNREHSDNVRLRHIVGLQDRVADLAPGDLIARQSASAMIQQEVASLSNEFNPFGTAESSSAAVAEARTLVAAQEAGFLPYSPDSGATAQTVARRHAVDDLQEMAEEIDDLAYAYDGVGAGVDAPEVYAQADALYQRLANQAATLQPDLVAAARADAAAAAAEPGNARLAAAAQQSAACLDDWREAIGNAQSGLMMMRVNAMEGESFHAAKSAELARAQANDAVDLAADALGEAGAPPSIVQAVRGLKLSDADMAANEPAAGSEAMAQARGALDALGLAPDEQAGLSGTLSRAGEALAAARRSAGHSVATENLVRQASEELEAIFDEDRPGVDPVERQRDLQTFFERNTAQQAAVHAEAAAARTAQEAAGAAAGQLRQGIGAPDTDLTPALPARAPAPALPETAAPPPPPLPQEGQPLVEIGTQAGRESRAAVEAAVRTHGGADTEAAQAAAEAALTARSTALAERILAHPQVRTALHVGGKVLTAAAVAALVAQLALAIRTDVKNGDRSGTATRRVLAELVGGVVGAEIGAAGGAAAGASAGAALGSVVPGLGTAAGALVGSAVGGFVGGLLGFGAGAYAGGQLEDEVQSLIDGWVDGGRQSPAGPGVLGELAVDPLANAQRLIRAGSSDDERVNAPELRRALTTFGYTVDADDDTLSRCIDAHSRAGDGALGVDELAAMLRDKSLSVAADGAIEVDTYRHSINLSSGDGSQAAGHIASRWIHLHETQQGGTGDERLNADELVDSLEASGYRLAEGTSEKDIARALSAYDRFGHGAVNHQDLTNALADGALVIDIDGSVSVNGSRLLGQADGQAANIALRIVQAGGQEPQAFLDASALHDNLKAAGYTPALSEADCATLIGQLEAPGQPGRMGRVALQQAIDHGLLVLHDDGTVRLPASPGK
ncbi:MAG: hypothetical protein V4739_01390 [Pseudomonadota bacterium]